MPERLVIVGGGKMGEALAAGLQRAGAGPISIVEVDAARRQELLARHRDLSVTDRVEASPGDGAVIAVKPPDVEAAAGALRAAGVGRVLSVAAGVTLAALESWLPDGTAVVRGMPNTPALVGAGAAAISAGRAAGPEDLDWAAGILGAVGTVVALPEAALDAVTGLSGSGPAYVFLVAEALIDAGVLVGLSRPLARDLAVQTLLGSARLLAETGDEPAALRAAVTSPAGTTAAGLRVLERAGLRSALLEAVAAATERSRQLGAG